MAYEYVIGDENTRPDTKAKVTGYLIKLRLISFSRCVCAYLDILEIITSMSKVFELEALMPNKVKPLLLETVNNIDDCIEGEFYDQMLFSNLASFRIVEGQLTSMFIKSDDPHKRNVDKERITYEFENMTSLEDDMLIRAIKKKKEVLKEF